CRAGKRSATRRFARWRWAYPAYEDQKKRGPWAAFCCLGVDLLLSPVSFKHLNLPTNQPACISGWWADH
ncbi:hypothetical protein ACVGV4_06960, partial [Enterobacter hormaechei]